MEVNNNIDAKLNLADWTKNTWDLPSTLDEFKIMYEDKNELRRYFFKLLYLPVGRAMPQSLIDELRKEYGQYFVPAYRDKKPKDESKDVYSGSATLVTATPLHAGLPARREELRAITRQRRRMRTRRVIRHRLPDKDK